MPPIPPETDASLRERILAEVRKHGDTNHPIHRVAQVETGRELELAGQPYGIVRGVFAVELPIVDWEKIARAMMRNVLEGEGSCLYNDRSGYTNLSDAEWDAMTSAANEVDRRRGRFDYKL